MNTTDPADADVPSGRPVFVDASGRRSSWVRRGGRIVTTLLVGYLLLVLAALVGPSELSRLTLPGLGPLLPGPEAATLADGEGDGSREGPRAVLEATSPPAARRQRPRPSPSLTRPIPSNPTPSSAAVATTAPGRAGTAPGQGATTAPGRRPRSPGPSAAPSGTATPTASSSPASPRNSRAPSPKPKPSRSPR